MSLLLVLSSGGLFRLAKQYLQNGASDLGTLCISRNHCGRYDTVNQQADLLSDAFGFTQSSLSGQVFDTGVHPVKMLLPQITHPTRGFVMLGHRIGEQASEKTPSSKSLIQQINQNKQTQLRIVRTLRQLLIKLGKPHCGFAIKHRTERFSLDP
ncbi:hypothetical protein [Pseudomonas sp. ADAK13]|uniref:hypothetical protein n=1 Tax=Pseudomonas sp. ADAK13 TaxID=2730847 RepID=UPI001463BA4B|nr:hypothetical protein [Pseudomonas sp. ADAK13]QJI37108.1 hypothetical protein HKK54_22715 [Pseudomonas sp. ADAK13]